MELNAPFLGRGLQICLEGKGEGYIYTHWTYARVWWWHGDPRLQPQIGGARANHRGNVL